MFRNFILSAFRNLVRNKFQSIIQILSLAIGLTVFTLIGLYLYDTLTVDSLNINKDQIFRIENHNTAFGSPGEMPFLMGPMIRENIPEILEMTRIQHLGMGDYLTVYADTIIEKQLLIWNNVMVDSGFLNVFQQEFLLGNPATALKDRFSIVLTESVAEKIFGSENPIGKTVEIRGDHTVTGVIKDPLNTHLKFDVLAGLPPRSEDVGLPLYVRLHKFADKAIVENRINEIWMQYRRESDPEYDHELDIYLCPLKEVPFSDFDTRTDYLETSNRKMLMNFFLLGLVILLLGIINYVNLNTARASVRSREIAVRKIAGSSRLKLIGFFLTESVITTFFSFLIAVTCIQLIFTRFNQLFQSDINLYFLKSPLSWTVAVFTILLIGILSGIYPALQMSSGSPVVAIKGDSKTGTRGIITRRILMLIQYTSAVMLMIGILFMQLQIRYMKNQDLGFTTEHIVWTNVGDLIDRNKILLSRLERIPEIEKVCFSMNAPGHIWPENNTLYDNPASLFDGINFDFMRAGIEFLEVYGLQLTHGNEILDKISLRTALLDSSGSNVTRYCIINESFRKAINLEDPIGAKVQDEWYIGGVVKDFHVRSLQYPVKPLSISVEPTGQGWRMSMRIKSSNIQRTLREVQKIVFEVNAAQGLGRKGMNPLGFKFIDETFNQQYEQVDRIHHASLYLFALAIIIACLGLFGLSTFMAQRRTKEIGIRKALGSSEEQVFLLLAKDFTKWVALSVLIGCPLGWYVMKQWQQQFAYKADIGIWVYVLVALIAFVIAFLTVAWQSLKVARTNPVDSLRDE